MNHLYKFFYLLCVMVLVSCGYHLRGHVDIPEGLKAVYLQGGSMDLRDSFNKSLKVIDGKLVEQIGDSTLVIEIVHENMDSRVLSLNTSGRITELELVYTVHYRLLDNAGMLLKDKQEIEVSRDYYNDQGEVLAKSNEDQVIREELYQQAVRTISQQAWVVLEDQS